MLFQGSLYSGRLADISISQATWWLFNEDIACGALVPILEDYEIETDPTSIIFPAPRRIPAKIRIVVDFLLELAHGT